VQYVREVGAGKRLLLADAALLLVTIIWGATFVMVKDAISAFPVFSFMAVRFVLAALTLTPLALWRRKQLAATAPSGPFASAPGGRDPLLNPSRLFRLSAPSAAVGSALFAGYAFQTAGLQFTTPAKAGFITGLSVVFVPVAAAALLRQPPPRNAWLGVGLATLGLGFLSLTANLRIQPGDLLVLGCAVSFAAHILLLGHFAPRHDPILLTLGQVVAVAVFSIVAALLFDKPTPVTRQVLFAAGFTGLLATAAAFGIQTVAQRFTTTTHTALIFAAEPVFAGLFSFLLIGEVLGPRQLVGCAMILGGMIVAEMRRTSGGRSWRTTEPR
jgi:drug/metabolite transporter (DMT)-like permease